VDLIDTKPAINVLETEYKRLLGFPADYVLEGRSRELANWAREWYASYGKPWLYARESSLSVGTDIVRVNDAAFTSQRLRELLRDSEAERAALVAVSAGSECEQKARELWLEDKPDEYFFLEVYGSAVVEHLITLAGARLCAWADGRRLAVLPHYSPGYSGWDISEQQRLFEALCRGNGSAFPGELRALSSGMLQPKKSLLAVFGITARLEKLDRFARLVPCESCAFSPCQFRRVPYKNPKPALEDVRSLQAGSASESSSAPLISNASYSVKPRALEKWSQERLQIKTLPDRSVEARFRYDGTTCSNLGRPLQYQYFIALGPPETNYQLREMRCAPVPGDTGHQAMCEYLNNKDNLVAAIASEKPLLGCPLNAVLDWQRPKSPAGCYCDADSRQHKWGLVLEVLHYTLARQGKNGRVSELR
jgi:hypothetical protein